MGVFLFWITEIRTLMAVGVVSVTLFSFSACGERRGGPRLISILVFCDLYIYTLYPGSGVGMTRALEDTLLPVSELRRRKGTSPQRARGTLAHSRPLIQAPACR